MENIVILPVSAIKPYEKNPRNNKEAVAKVAASLREFGFRQPIVVDKDYVIIAGHTRLLAAKKLKLTEVPVLVADDLTDEQAKAYRLADNKTAEFAEWDTDLLNDELSEILDIDMTDFGFDLDLDDDDDEDEGEIEEDDPSDDAPSRCKLGDVWQLGTHRLICGDSTDVAVIDKLMDGEKADMVFTDPPYGVSANGGRRDIAKKLGMDAILNDDLRNDDLYDFLESCFSIMPMKDGASVYICYPWATQLEFTRAIKDCGLNIQNCIIWRKNGFGLNGFKGYRPQYEMIYFCSNGDYEWYGDLAQSNVWDFDRPTEHIGNHPTPKPIALIAKAITNSSKKKDIVLDVFGGSGSTLIACEQTGRRCFMAELSEHYCDVIINRWEQLTGESAERIVDGESEEMPF